MTVAATCLLACLSLGMGADATCPTDDLLRRPYFLPVNNLSSAQLHPLISYDFDGDGFEDLLAVNQDTIPATIDLFISKGRGSFSARTRYETVGTPTDLILADLDGDTVLDMAFLDGTADSFAVRLGQGGTSFGPELRVALPAPSVRLVAGDPDNDGDTDLAFAGGTSSDGVHLLTNDGTGVFSLGPVLEGATRWDAVGLGDLNGDGIDDAILTNSTTVLTMVSDGAGGFLPPTAHAVNGPVGRLTLDDLDLDGALDVIARANDAHVLFGNGDGTLAPQLVLDTFNARFGLVSRDVNADGFPELLSLGIGGTLYIHTNNGDRSFTDDRITLDGGGGGSNLCAGDFDHDGLVDLGRANFSSFDSEIGRGLSISPGDGQGGFTQPTSVLFPSGVSEVHAADMNDDGLVDLVLCSFNTSEIIIRHNNGDGGFLADVLVPTANSPRWISTGDFDGNGLVDAVVYGDSASSPNEQRIHLQMHAGVFVSIPLSGPTTSFRIRAVDADGDAHLDLIYDSDILGTASVLHGIGDGTFTPGQVLDLPVGDIRTVDLSDLDGDGTPDVIARTSLNELVRFDGLGGGVFSTTAAALGITISSDFRLLDLNGDAITDIITSNSALLGSGDGTFTLFQSLDANRDSVFDLADLDSDGLIDVINYGFFSPQRDSVTLLLGNGDGSFGEAIPVAALAFGGQYRTAAADFSGDGSTDLFLARDPGLAVTTSLIELRSVCPATTSPCPADCDASGAVDFNDLVAMLFEFGNPDPSDSCDADLSGAVDFNDLVTALFLFGACP